MKKTFLRLVSLLLLLAMLLPLAVACKKDPPPDDDGDDDDIKDGENCGQYYISSAFKEWKSYPLVDYGNADFIAANPRVGEKVASVAGKPGYTFNTAENPPSFVLTSEQTNLSEYYYISFSVYSESVTNTEISIKLIGWRAAVNIPIDFSGWRTFNIQIDSFNVVNPQPTVSHIQFSKASGENITVYISNISATLPVYELSTPEGVSLDDPTLYTGITSAYKDYLVGKGASESAEYQAKLATVNAECEAAWNSFNATKPANYEPNVLFGLSATGVDAAFGQEYPVNGASALIIYEEVKKLAYGYGTAGSAYYQNPELLEAIKYSLEYCYLNYYGKDIVETGVTNGNWWEWDIGIPFALTEVLCIAESGIPHEDILKYISPFDKINSLPVGSGANLIDIAQTVMLSAAFHRDAYKLCSAKELLAPLFAYAEDASEILGDGGFFRDGSYVQHNFVPYAGLYGQQLINHLAAVLYFTGESRFAFVGETYEAPYRWIFDSFSPFMYEGSFMSAMRGRSVSYYTEKYSFNEAACAFIKLAAGAPEAYKSRIESLIKAIMLETGNDFTSLVPISLIEYCVNIKNNSSIALPEATVSTRIYGNMDRVLQRTGDYAVAVALSSNRIARYESINTNNRSGWYHGDGMIYIYTDGYSFSSDFFWYSNPYLMPGVTSNNAERNFVNIHPMMFNAKKFAGGAEQGKYGVVGYSLDYRGTDLRGTFAVSSEATLYANKSYFLFDDEIICMGTGINDASGTGVKTTVENRIWREGDKLYINGSEITSLATGTAVSPTTLGTQISARTLYFTGMGGYVFLRTNSDGTDKDGNTVYYRKATYDSSANSPADKLYGTGTRSFLEINFSHGSGAVIDGRYFYAYLPEATVQETEAYLADPDVLPLAYVPNTHAVLETKLGIFAANFFTEGDNDTVSIGEGYYTYTNVRGVEADTPCSVMISKNAAGETVISVSDPTQSFSNTVIRVTLESVSEVISADPDIKTKLESSTVSITVNTQNACGKTFTVTVK